MFAYLYALGSLSFFTLKTLPITIPEIPSNVALNDNGITALLGVVHCFLLFLYNFVGVNIFYTSPLN
jgi:hypothetical protein